MLTSNISHSQQSQLLTSRPLRGFRGLNATFYGFCRIVRRAATRRWPLVIIMSSTTLRCQRALGFFNSYGLSVSITNNIPRHQCHMVRCKRPPKAAFQMSMAAGSAKHICSSLGNGVIYSIPYLSNQLLRGDIASSDVFNGLRCS